MDELISREATIKRIKEVYCVGCNSYHGVRCRACGTGDAIDIIDDFPAADVDHVRHGRWVKIYENGEPKVEQHQVGVFCSKCMNMPKDRFTESDYCPNCGAKMDEGKV